MPNKSVFVATPCYGGLVYYNYVRSLLDTVVHLNNNGVGVKIAGMGNESLITRARNQMVAQFMETDCSHMMFIDADVGWNGADVKKLLDWDKEIIGGVYPMKQYFFEKSESAFHDSFDANNTFSPTMFKSKLLTYPVNYASDTIDVKKGLVSLKHIPTGFMLVKRCVFEKMMKKYPEMKLTQDANRDPSIAKWVYNFFDCMVEPSTGCYLSEDYAFCHRYLDLDRDNNEIYADISVGLSHTGTHTFEGHYVFSLIPKNFIK